MSGFEFSQRWNIPSPPNDIPVSLAGPWFSVEYTYPFAPRCTPGHWSEYRRSMVCSVCGEPTSMQYQHDPRPCKGRK